MEIPIACCSSSETNVSNNNPITLIYIHRVHKTKIKKII